MELAVAMCTAQVIALGVDMVLVFSSIKEVSRIACSDLL